MLASRFRAFAVHLAISVVVGILVLGMVFGAWHPAPLHKAVGVTQIFLLLLMVDVILGPCLTFVVFSPGKKSLVFDLTVIGLLQLAALTYGVWVVSEGRPAWLVFNVDRFDVVRVVDIDERSLARAPAEYRVPSWLGPRWVAATRPDDTDERAAILFEALTSGVDLPQRPEYYRSLESAASEIREKARSLEELAVYNEAGVVLSTLQRWPAADGWLALMSNAEAMVVLVQKAEGKVLAIVDLRPWGADPILE